MSRSATKNRGMLIFFAIGCGMHPVVSLANDLSGLHKVYDSCAKWIEVRSRHKKAYNTLEGVTSTGTKWIKIRSSREDASNTPEWTTFTGWVAGYLYGFYASGVTPSRPVSHMDAGRAFSWVDAYCARHPSDHLPDAMSALVKYLSIHPYNLAKCRFWPDVPCKK